MQLYLISHAPLSRNHITLIKWCRRFQLFYHHKGDISLVLFTKMSSSLICSRTWFLPAFILPHTDTCSFNLFPFWRDWYSTKSFGSSLYSRWGWTNANSPEKQTTKPLSSLLMVQMTRAQESLCVNRLTKEERVTCLPQMASPYALPPLTTRGGRASEARCYVPAGKRITTRFCT